MWLTWVHVPRANTAVAQVKWELWKEHQATWRTNGLADLKYKVLQKRQLCDTHRAMMVTVDVGLNNHWSDTVETPPQA